MRIQQAALTCLFMALAACGPAASEGEPALGTTSKLLRAKDPIPGQYIVVLAAPSPGIQAVRASELSVALAARHGASIQHIYEHALRGFSAQMSEEQARALAADPAVRFVEEDSTVQALAAPWHLDRIDQRALPLDGIFATSTTGAGVNAYIIDTGLRITHVHFGGRATADFDALGGNGLDCNGHGTAVAGVLGGSAYGVATGANLHGIRVLDCNGSGSFANVIAGINWVTANHVKPAVANMSLGGGASVALDDAVRASIAAGVTYTVPLGSSRAGTCSSSPSRVTEAISVGGSTAADAVAPFSDYGPCLDLFAPAQNIVTSWATSDTAITTLSGNSFAAPLAAGAAALYLEIDPTATPATVQSLITLNATAGVLTGVPPGTANRLLYTGFVGRRLLPGIPVIDPNHGPTDQRYYTVSVPAGMIQFDVRASGGTGDADLYVRYGAPPTLTSYDCRPYRAGNNETCSIPNPSAGTWFIMLRGFTAYSGLNLAVQYY